MTTSPPTLDSPASAHENTAFKVLGAIGFSHFLNDMIQSLLPAIYPLLKSSFFLSFTQIGLITLTFQITASLLQPMVGLYTDHHPKPYSLSTGMGCTLTGLIMLAFAPGYGILLTAAALVGTGSSVFHCEGHRIRLSPLFIPTAIRFADGFPARHRQAAP
jgi:FSR family fosmidomycin resistance protein-like MFS transporter